MAITIYHNPRCRKSRETLKLLEDRGIRPKIINYLETPPSVQELKKILKLLKLMPMELVRRKETEFKTAKLDRPGISDADVIQAMVKYPKLIERPIVIAGQKATLGRPPENVLKIL
jgi:arsenate reductase (glutaredoxin)